MKFKYLLIAVRGENNGSEQIDNARYMGFTISMPSAVTKAADTGGTGSYVVGEGYENDIKTIHFYFYRKGAYVSWGYGDVAKQFDSNTGTGDVEEKLDNSSEAGKGVVVLESTMAIPDQVLCVINSRNYQWYRNKSLETVMNAIHSGTAESLTGNVTDSYKDFAFLDEGKPYFVMFTSPMYGTKAGTTSTKEVKYVSDIFVEETAPGSGKFTANSYIKNNRQDAMDKPLEIYVERMAARFDIDNLKKVADGGIIADASNYVDKTKMDASLLDASGNPLWDIEPLAWSVTAHNKTAYSLKHINTGWFSQTGVNQPFNGGWLQSGGSCKNPVKTTEDMFTRINWAMDPNYGSIGPNDPPLTNRNAYPHSARELLDESQLKYWSATEVANNYGAAEKSQLDLLQRYSYENTFGLEGQKSPRINGTMLLLYAQVKKAGAAAYEDLYAYMGQMQSFKEYVAQLLSTMDAHGYTFYILDGTTYKPIHKPASLGGYLENFTDPSKAYLKIVKATKIDDFYASTDKPGAFTNNTPAATLDAYPDMVVDLSGSLQPKLFEGKFAAVPDDFLNTDAKGYADGYVTLVPNTSMPTLYVDYHDNPSTPDIEYTVATPAEIAEGFLNGVVEPANKYTEGRMYYAIPIEHYGKAVDNATDKNPLEGNYGVVRNNFYKVSIGTIKSLGHGIDDVSEPIVPGDRKKPYYLAAKINILSWQVATQEVDLEE